MSSFQKLMQYEIGFRNTMMKAFRNNVNNITKIHPTFLILKKLYNKGILDPDQIEMFSFVNSKEPLTISQKKIISNMAKNSENQSYKTYRCTECDLDLPGDTGIINSHALFHMKKGNMEMEFHPYKY